MTGCFLCCSAMINYVEFASVTRAENDLIQFGIVIQSIYMEPIAAIAAGATSAATAASTATTATAAAATTAAAASTTTTSATTVVLDAEPGVRGLLRVGSR